MLVAYVIVTIVTAALNLTWVWLDWSRNEWVVGNMTTVGLKPWTLYPLGALKLAGGVGLLVGFAVPALGIAAAIGLILFYSGAVAQHVRVHVGNLQYPGMFLLFAASSLVLRLATL